MNAVLDKIIVGIIILWAGYYLWRRFFYKKRFKNEEIPGGDCNCCGQDCPSQQSGLFKRDQGSGSG